MLRFRTHRSLFKHLHVCSDRAGSPAPPQKAEKPVPPATSTLEKELPAKAAEGLPKLPSIIQHTEKEAIIPGADTAPAAPATLPASLPELPSSLEAMPLVSPAPHPFPLLEPNLFGPSSLTRFSGPPPSSVPFLSYVHPSPYGLPPPPAQPRLRPFVPSHGPPVSNAIWKKSQGERGQPLGQTFCSRLDQQLLDEDPPTASEDPSPPTPPQPRATAAQGCPSPSLVSPHPTPTTPCPIPPLLPSSPT